MRARLMVAPGQLPACDVCGEAVGVYEPLQWRRPDGSLLRCGWLEAREHPDHDHPLSRFFHLDCLQRLRASD